ncbi:MAG: NAD-dependent deacylase [Alphaproteobacteria bacterium]|nr:NAD-dependent deacylase [Alphaproteobacteria bacterium]
MQFFKNIVVLTGAGISAESGVPVFRGEDGLWHGRRVEDVATHEALRRDLWGVNGFFNELRRFVHAIEPNPAHLALKRLEEHYGNRFLLVTQNIDPLHQRAGSKRLITMHGQLQSALCTQCGARAPFYKDIAQDTPCPSCGKTSCLRPDIVLFNEQPYEMNVIIEALLACDLFIAVGTSGFVYPAAGFVDIARQCGAHTIEANLTQTECSPLFKEKCIGPAGQTLPALVERLLA